MKTIKIILLSSIMGLFIFQGCKKDSVNPDPLSSSEYFALKDAMRKLWTDHMQWTYSTVDAYFHDQNGLQAQLDRLLQNQKEIGNAIVPYYGQAAGDTLSVLLTTHIQLAVPVLEAAKNNDQEALQKALENWNNNAKEIAHFLSTANPENWSVAEMEHQMLHHIEQTTTYSVDLLKADYTNAILHFDEALNHMIGTSDIIARGIVLQFPERF